MNRYKLMNIFLIIISLLLIIIMPKRGTMDKPVLCPYPEKVTNVKVYFENNK